MNGFALLVALSSLGVDYVVQQSEDGKLEYVIQIEPEVLRLMAEGQQIQSDVPPDAGAIERVLVRVGMSPAKHSQQHLADYRHLLVQGSRFASAAPGAAAPDAAAAIVWPAKSKPELNYNVTTGYQPDTATGVQTYFVQINSTLMQSLQVGDEIRVAVDPAAGKVGRFMILSGNSELPKIPVEPVATIAPPAGVGRGAGRGAAGGFGAAATVPTAPPTQPGYGSPFNPAPTTDRNSVPLASTPDYRTQDYAAAATQPPLYSPATGRFGSGGDVATDHHSPAPATAPPTYGPAPTYGSRFETQPQQYEYNQSPGYVSQTGGQQPAAQLPPQLPPRTNAFAPTTSQLPPPPTTDDRLASRNASLSNTAPQVTLPTTTRSAADSSAAESRWMPLMFTVFALFLSIGGNLYLGWTAAEFYSRYRLATERLRSAGR